MDHTGRHVLLVALSLTCSFAAAQTDGTQPERNRLQGRWRITELVDDGSVIPADRIKLWLPSGGRVEIVENGLIFTDRLDGKKRIKTFSIDPATYPKRIVFVAQEKVESQGIYKFDNERLVVCLGIPTLTAFPTDFSAHQGSRRMLLVLERDTERPAEVQLADLPPPPMRPTAPPAQLPAPPSQPAPATPATTTPVPAALSDSDVANLIVGTWRLSDGAGLLDVTFDRNGTFRSSRESLELSTFHSVFVQTPVSSGTWGVKQGSLTTHVTKSTRPDRVGQTIALQVRTISLKDLVFIDGLGRVGQATKLR